MNTPLEDSLSTALKSAYVSANMTHCLSVRPTISCADASLQVSNLRISEADIEISRDRISEFLSTHSAYELLPDSGKV